MCVCRVGGALQKQQSVLTKHLQAIRTACCDQQQSMNHDSLEVGLHFPFIVKSRSSIQGFRLLQISFRCFHFRAKRRPGSSRGCFDDLCRSSKLPRTGRLQHDLNFDSWKMLFSAAAWFFPAQCPTTCFRRVLSSRLLKECSYAANETNGSRT